MGKMVSSALCWTETHGGSVFNSDGSELWFEPSGGGLTFKANLIN